MLTIKKVEFKMQELNLLQYFCERLIVHKNHVKTLSCFDSSSGDGKKSYSLSLEDVVDNHFVQITCTKDEDNYTSVELSILKFLNQGEEKVNIKKSSKSFYEEESLAIDDVVKTFFK